MAYSRYVPEIEDGDNNIYGLMDEEARGQLSDLNSALDSSVKQINGETISGSRDSSGSVYIEYYFAAGQRYLLTNTSQSAAIVAATQNVKGTDVQRITNGMAANGTKEFTATENAKYLWVFGDGAFSFSITESSSVGYYVDNTVVPMVERATDRIDDLQTELQTSIKQINGDAVTGSRDSSGSVYIEYYFVAGQRYLLTNTSQSAAIVAATQNVQGTDVQRITNGMTANGTKEFTATENAKYLWVFGDGAFSFSITESSSVGYYVDNTVVPMVERATDRIDDLQYDAIIEKTSSGTAYIDYNFEVGEKYEYTNLYSGATVADTVNEKTQSAATVDSITGGALGQSTFCLIPTANATALRVFFDSANGKAGIRKVGTPIYDLNRIENSYGKLTKQQTYSVNNGINTVYYPMKTGVKYRVRNISSGSGASYACQLYTRSTPKGENIETISSSLYPGRSVVFTAGNDTDFVRIVLGNSSISYTVTVSIDEVGTVLDSFGNSSRKQPYQSGQIHFTVPVNQKRLYKTQSSVTTAQDDETDIENVNCVCMLPTSYTEGGEKTKLLMICHGSGGGVTATEWFRNEPTVLAFFQQFIDEGYAIFDCNGYANGSSGQESFGVDTAIIAYHAAYQYMVKNYNVEENLNIYGFSMGGLTALNYVNMFPGGIKCLALGSPLVSIYKTVWVDYTVQAKGEVAAAYGFANSTDYEADTVGNCDPYARIKTIGLTEMCFDPLPTTKIWHGTADTATQPAYSEDYADAVRNTGRFCYYRPVDGKGHEICYGGNAVVTGEIIAFLNRYN